MQVKHKKKVQKQVFFVKFLSIIIMIRIFLLIFAPIINKSAAKVLQFFNISK